mgnify:CR=1 FL=1
MRFANQRIVRERFILRVAELLHAQGTPTHRGEALVGRLGATLRVPLQISFSPTELLLSFGREPDVRTVVRRVAPGGTQLGQLAATTEVLDDVFAGRLGLERARRKLERIARRQATAGPGTLSLATALTSASAAPLLGGGPREVAAGALLGALVAVVEHIMRSSARTRLLAEPTCAVFVGAASHGLAATWFPHADGIVALATLIVLVPGLTFTTAMVELATGHWSAGTARMAAAFGTFLQLAVGVALGRTLADACFAGAVAAQAPALPLGPAWAMFATGVAALSFALLFRARTQDWLWIVLACMFTSLGHTYGVALLGPRLGAFGGALVLGLLSNAFAAGGRRPALVLLTPGILLLVPGSVGYRSLDLLMANDIVAGLQTAVEMLVIASSIVAGLLVANGVLPARRDL